MKKLLLLLAFIGVPFFAFDALARGPRLMTYNIRHGADMDNVLDLQRIAAVIERLRPDFVAVSDYGLLPGTGADARLVVDQILSEHGDKPLTIVFAPGRYDFYPDSLLQSKRQDTPVFRLVEMKDVTIDGAGADFVFHGRCQPFYLEGTSNILMKNFTIDWDYPYIAQAEIVDACDDHVDFKIDSRQYPFMVEDSKLLFQGEYHVQKIENAYLNLYDENGDILYRTVDKPLGKALLYSPATLLQDSTVRFSFTPAMIPPKGTRIQLYFGRYLSEGFKMVESAGTVIKDVTIYHAPGMGLRASRSHDITLTNVKIVPSGDRVFSTVADATHFNGCTGDIVLDGCRFEGQGDDFINVKSMYSPVSEVISENCLRIAPTKSDLGFRHGEKVWLIDSVKFLKSKLYEVDRTEMAEDGYLLYFKEPVSASAGYLVENASTVANLTVRNCVIARKNRARGILFTTPGKVVIENNVFSTAGAAILIEGDCQRWYESGAVNDVVIRNNIFDACYSSGNNIDYYPWGWGEAPITITPTFRPQNESDVPYHRNITITDNEFRLFDYPIMYARGVGGLKFTGNKLTRSYKFEPYYRKTGFYLDGCREVVIENNTFSEDCLGRNLETVHMAPSDLSVQKDIAVTIGK